MRNLRVVGVLALAVVIGIAFGATTAFAKNIALCKENVKECPEKSRYPTGTKITEKLAEGTKVAIKSTFRTVECKKNEMIGETETEAASQLDLEITTVTFAECSSGEKECTVKALGLGWWGYIAFYTTPWYHYHMLGHFSDSDPQVELTCSGVTCIYGNNLIGEFLWEDGAPATIYANGLELEKEGGSFLCSSTATWTATYTVTSPSPVYVKEVT